jgi:hypothetical protein
MQTTEPPQNTNVEDRIQGQLKNATSLNNESKTGRLIKAAIKYGVIHPGWSCIDYMFYAARHHGWESTCISGGKGTLKSNLMLQHGKAIYGGDMQKVTDHFVTKRKTLLELIEYAIENDISIPWIGVDDIAALFPASLYFTHRKLYSALQASWETFRTVMNNFEFSCVIKKKVASFILDDITGDLKTYGPVTVDHQDGSSDYIKGHYDYRRWLWLRNLKDPTRDIAKLIAVEDIPFPVTPDSLQIDPELKSGTFYSGGEKYKGSDFYLNHACLTGIDRNYFRDYWNNRLGLAKDAYSVFTSILEQPATQKNKNITQGFLPPQPAGTTMSPSEMGRRSGEARRLKRLELEKLQMAQEANDDSE